MSFKNCKKCNVKFRQIQLVCCKNCNGYFDRKCAKELCDEVGEWAIPPTKLVKWSCTECQMQPARVCCDVCRRTLGGSSPFAACGKCGRHVCRACAGLARRALARHQQSRVPWLCLYCCESPRDVPASWNNDKIFAAAYVRFPTLWNPNATEAELEHASASLGRALGLTAPAQALQRCRQFAHKYKYILRRLTYRYRTSAEILRHAPGWVRETELRLNWLPSIMQSVWLPKEPEEILHELARRIRTSPRDPSPKWSHHVVRVVATRLSCPAPALKDVWTQAVRVALLKLQTLALVGDVECVAAARLRPHEWLAVDATLLHSDKRAEWLVGYLNSQVWLLHLLVRLVQQFRLEEKCPPARLRERWLSAYKQYVGSGLKSSVIVLQRRWWELKIETHINMRMRMRGNNKRALLPHHALIARRYPHVVTGQVLSWGELRNKQLIVDATEEQVKLFKDYVTPLPVADDDLVLSEANKLVTNFESTNTLPMKQENLMNPKTQQVVAQLKRDVKELKNLDKMQNLSLTPLIQNYEDDLSQISGEKNNKSVADNLSALKDLDPKIASTNIIFESDSDVEDEDKNESPEGEDTDSADSCQILEWKTETCVLSDDSDVVFKSKKSNIGVCIAVANETTEVKDENDLVINETEPIVGESDAATDPKLRMVPIVPLVRVDEQTQITGSKRPQDVRNVCQDAIIALKKDLIEYQIPDEGAGEKRETEDVVENKEDTLGSKVPKVIQDTCKDAIVALHKDLIGYKIPEEDASGKDCDAEESSVGSDAPPPKRLERPWGYKGPLTGRVEDLSWLCTSVSVTLEKLPEDILNNVRVSAASRRVWLPDIEQVRRDTKRMLVAQVAPLLHVHAGGATPQRHSRAQSFESSVTSKSSSPSMEDYGLLTQPPDDKDSTDPISEAQLQTVLQEIQESRKTSQHCCVARRHRAYNDARRRHATRAGRGDSYVEFDLHGARHGSRGACSCCCRHLLAAPAQSLAALQRVLLRSLDALLRKRGETPSDKTPSDNSDQLKRTHIAQSSSDEERLVIDVPQPQKPKRPNKKKKRRKTKVTSKKRTDADEREANKNQKRQKTKEINDESDEERRKKADYNEWIRQRCSHRRFFQPPGTQDSTIIYLSKQQDQVVTKKSCIIVRPDLQDHTYANTPNSKTIFMKLTETVPNETATSAANLAPLVGGNTNQNEPTVLRNQPHSQGPSNGYTSSNVAFTVTSIPNDTNQSQHPQTNLQEKATSSVTPSNEHTNCETTQNAIQYTIANKPETRPQSELQLTSRNLVNTVESASLPVSQQPQVNTVQSPNVFVTPHLVNHATLPHPASQSSAFTFDNHQKTGYFMIYQPPSASMTDQSTRSMPLVPVAINMPTEQATQNTSCEALKERKSIFQENFRQKMVQNLSLLSGGGLLADNDMQNQLESQSMPSVDESEASPRIFDELPSTSNVPDGSPFPFPMAPFLPADAVACGIPTMDSSLPLMATNCPILSNSLPTMATNLPIMSTSLPTMATNFPKITTSLPTMATNLPVMSTLPSMAANLPIMSTSLPMVATNLPTAAPSLMPTITSVVSLAEASRDSEDDDDCVITSPPVPRTIIIVPDSLKTRNKIASKSNAWFINPVSLYREVPEHISAFVQGGGTAPFSLLRLDAERRLWALPGGHLVLTDTAVACRNIKYFIINSSSLKRMVPVHFDRLEPAQGRIRVRSFAKMAAEDAPPTHEASVDEMLTEENKLFKRLADDPPIYARVLTGLTDVVSAELLAASGHALLVYAPSHDALALVRADAAARTLHCERAGVAQHIAGNFNYNGNSPTWTVAPSSSS